MTFCAIATRWQHVLSLEVLLRRGLAMMLLDGSGMVARLLMGGVAEELGERVELLSPMLFDVSFLLTQHLQFLHTYSYIHLFTTNL